MLAVSFDTKEDFDTNWRKLGRLLTFALGEKFPKLVRSKGKQRDEEEIKTTMK